MRDFYVILLVVILATPIAAKLRTPAPDCSVEILDLMHDRGGFKHFDNPPEDPYEDVEPIPDPPTDDWYPEDDAVVRPT